MLLGSSGAEVELSSRLGLTILSLGLTQVQAWPDTSEAGPDTSYRHIRDISICSTKAQGKLPGRTAKPRQLGIILVAKAAVHLAQCAPSPVASGVGGVAQRVQAVAQPRCCSPAVAADSTFCMHACQHHKGINCLTFIAAQKSKGELPCQE